jgi:hypothetical protein
MSRSALEQISNLDLERGIDSTPEGPGLYLPTTTVRETRPSPNWVCSCRFDFKAAGVVEAEEKRCFVDLLEYSSSAALAPSTWP